MYPSPAPAPPVTVAPAPTPPATTLIKPFGPAYTSVIGIVTIVFPLVFGLFFACIIGFFLNDLFRDTRISTGIAVLIVIFTAGQLLITLVRNRSPEAMALAKQSKKTGTTLPLPKLTTAPGRKLKVRLSGESTGATCVSALIAMLVMGALFTGGGFLFMNFVNNVSGGFHARQLIPLVLFMGVLMLSTGLWRMLANQRAYLPGMPSVELDAEPLAPGQVAQIQLNVPNTQGLNTVRLCLQCKELATYGYGSDSTTDNHIAFEQILYEQHVITSGAAVQEQIQLAVPAMAPYSFKSDANEIRWQLQLVLLTGSQERKTDFPLRILPRGVRL